MSANEQVPTKVSVIGASGRMGSEVCRAVESAEGLVLAGGDAVEGDAEVLHAHSR